MEYHWFKFSVFESPPVPSVPLNGVGAPIHEYDMVGKDGPGRWIAQTCVCGGRPVVEESWRRGGWTFSGGLGLSTEREKKGQMGRRGL